MELMIPHDCHNCGLVDEAKFTYAGPHIKQVCNGCGRYVKFFNKSDIPDHRETRIRIWSIAKEDVTLIESAKFKCGFTSNVTGLDLKIMYWRLYLTVRELCL